MSFSERIRYSSSSYLNSVPAYLANSTDVADLDIHRDAVAVIVAAALADGDDRAALRLLFGGVRDDDPGLGGLLAASRLHDDAVAQGLELDGRCGSVSSWPRLLLLLPFNSTDPPSPEARHSRARSVAASISTLQGRVLIEAVDAVD